MSDSKLAVVPIEDVILDRVALRESVDKEHEDWPGFVASIKEKGILLPLAVRRLPDDGSEHAGKYCVIDGMHRYEGALEAGLTEVPVSVYDVEDEIDVMRIQVMANRQKFETRPVQFLHQIQRIMAQSAVQPTMAEIADMFKMSTSWVQKVMGLRKLKPEVLALIDNGSISAANAYFLSRLPEPEIESGGWVERAQTTSAEEFAAAATQRAKALNRKPQGEKAEFQAPIVLRKKGDIQQAWFDAHNKIEKLDDDVLNSYINTDAYNAGVFAALAWTLSQDPETVEAARQEVLARQEQSAAKKAEAEREKLASKAAAKGVSILAPKGENVPLGF